MRTPTRTRSPAPPRRAGTTLVELLVALVVVGIVAAIAIPRGARLRDGAAVRAAAIDAEQAFALARARAVDWRSAVAVRIDTGGARLEIRRGRDLLLLRALGEEYGVRLSSTRDSLAYDARGLGRGAANLTLVVRRGSAAESLVVSRLGRLRR